MAIWKGEYLPETSEGSCANDANEKVMSGISRIKDIKCESTVGKLCYIPARSMRVLRHAYKFNAMLAR